MLVLNSNDVYSYNLKSHIVINPFQKIEDDNVEIWEADSEDNEKHKGSDFYDDIDNCDIEEHINNI